MTMFCNYGQPYVPGICSLTTSTASSSTMARSVAKSDRATGKEFREWVNREGEGLHSRWSRFKVTYMGREPPQPPPHLTLDGLNHPILAWAEMESFRLTADRARLAMVYEPLVKYYRALQKYIRQGNGLYMTDWASMDNSPRNKYLASGGTAVDTSSQMVLFARNLAEIAEVLNKNKESTTFSTEASELARLINEKMWDPDRKFYFDLTLDGKRSPVKTIAAFWTLVAVWPARSRPLRCQPSCAIRKPSAGSTVFPPSRPTSPPSSRAEGTGKAPSGRPPTPW